MAEHAIRDLDQAKRYLDDPTLGERLRTCRLMLRHAGKSALQILGAPDDLKFRSCLTLFAQPASNDDDRCLIKQALDQFYEGGPDPLRWPGSRLMAMSERLADARQPPPLVRHGPDGFIHCARINSRPPTRARPD